MRYKRLKGFCFNYIQQFNNKELSLLYKGQQLLNSQPSKSYWWYQEEYLVIIASESPSEKPTAMLPASIVKKSFCYFNRRKDLYGSDLELIVQK